MSKKYLLGSVALAALCCAPALAADLQRKAPPPPPSSTWAGGYVGLTAGADWGSFDPTTSTSTAQGNLYKNAADIAAINAVGMQSIKPPGFIGGVEAGYNWQWGSWVAGIEADASYVHLNGAANSGAVFFPAGGSGAFFINGGLNFPINKFVVSSYADTDWLVTLRPRVGFTAEDNWLFYITGGLALTQLNADFVFTDAAFEPSPPAASKGNFTGLVQSGRINGAFKVGSVVGGGIEHKISDRLSVKAEYLYVDFGTTTATTTSTQTVAFITRSQAFTQTADLKENIVRVGLNYNFNGADRPLAARPPFPTKAPVLKAPALVPSNWEFETGARVWFSTGTIGAPQPLFGTINDLRSRLTYNGLDAVSGETFARVDHNSGWFAKGYLGAGGVERGSLFDEDFPAGNAYSKTISSASGNLGYATIDAGYNFLRAPGARVGAFVGYNYYDQHVNTYSCTQLAGGGACTPGGVPTNFLVIAEDDRIDSLRIGLAAQMMLTDRLRLTADAAYLPWVNFKGLDDHNDRELQLPEAATSGDGVMLEAVLDYKITDAWSVGLGGRYWAWNTGTGTVTFNFLGAPGAPGVQPGRFNTERYGAFLQTSYHWGDTSPAASARKALPVKAPVLEPTTNWTGIYIGGNLGGGWSNDIWSDPFGPTRGLVAGSVNVAGFGDKTRATGPLGGGQIGANIQNGQWVFGVQADGDLADLRGENTCFSGLGGINCQRIVNSLGTITGRAGYAWGRSLAYVKGGGAWVNDTYNLNGNTAAIRLGTGSTSATSWGWTVGAGVEYALTANWSTALEYDHIDVASTNVPFPTVALVNTQSIAVKQWIDAVKLGVNYKFMLDR